MTEQSNAVDTAQCTRHRLNDVRTMDRQHHPIVPVSPQALWFMVPGHPSQVSGPRVPSSQAHTTVLETHSLIYWRCIRRNVNVAHIEMNCVVAVVLHCGADPPPLKKWPLKKTNVDEPSVAQHASTLLLHLVQVRCCAVPNCY